MLLEIMSNDKTLVFWLISKELWDLNTFSYDERKPLAEKMFLEKVTNTSFRYNSGETTTLIIFLLVFATRVGKRCYQIINKIFAVKEAT